MSTRKTHAIVTFTIASLFVAVSLASVLFFQSETTTAVDHDKSSIQLVVPHDQARALSTQQSIHRESNRPGEHVTAQPPSSAAGTSGAVGRGEAIPGGAATLTSTVTQPLQTTPFGVRLLTAAFVGPLAASPCPRDNRHGVPHHHGTSSSSPLSSPFSASISHAQRLLAESRAFFTKELSKGLAAHDTRSNIPADRKGRNRVGQIDDPSLHRWLCDAASAPEESASNASRQSRIKVDQRLRQLVRDGYRQVATREGWPGPALLCSPLFRWSGVALTADEDAALAKGLRAVGGATSCRGASPDAARHLLNHFFGNVSLAELVDCQVASMPERPILVTGFRPVHFEGSHGTQNPPTTVPAAVAGTQLPSHTIAQDTSPATLPLVLKTFQSRIIRHKKAAWMSLRNVCVVCDYRRGGDRRRFYMSKTLPCVPTVYSIGPSEAQLGPLAAHKTSGRHRIFSMREAAYQYGGHLPTIAEMLKIASSSSSSSVSSDKTNQARPPAAVEYWNGTTVLAAPFAVPNVGHVIQDALWGLAESFLVGREAHRPGGLKLEIAQQRELEDAAPLPVRLAKPPFFEEGSSPFYRHLTDALIRSLGALDTTVPTLGVIPEVRSLFSDVAGPAPRSVAACFEALVIGGEDRQLSGGHFSFARRRQVASFIREAAFAHLAGASFPLASERESNSLPQIYVYGRNDVHRRSIDNIGALFAAVRFVAQAARLPDPILIATFTLSPAQQIRLAMGIDILVTIQGAHMQNSLFMPEDAAVLEIAPCGSDKVSFLKRYGMYLESQQHFFLTSCKDLPPSLGLDAAPAFFRSFAGAASFSSTSSSSVPSSSNVAAEGPGFINFSENDMTDQNLTLCPGMLRNVQLALASIVDRMTKGRARRR